MSRRTRGPVARGVRWHEGSTGTRGPLARGVHRQPRPMVLTRLTTSTRLSTGLLGADNAVKAAGKGAGKCWEVLGSAGKCWEVLGRVMLTLEKGDRGCGRPYSDRTPTGLRPTSYQTPTIHTPTGLLGWEGWEGYRHRLLSAALACESTYSSHFPFGDCTVCYARKRAVGVPCLLSLARRSDAMSRFGRCHLT